MRTVLENIDFSKKNHLFHYLGKVELLLNICPTFEDYYYYRSQCYASDFWGRTDYEEHINLFNKLILKHCHDAFVSLEKASGKKMVEPSPSLKTFNQDIDTSKYAIYGAAIGLAVGLLESALFGVFGLAVGAATGSFFSKHKIIRSKEYREQCYEKAQALAFCNSIEAANAYAKVMQPVVDELQERQLDREQICLLRYLKKRNITTLIHVTDRDNIKSIMTHGLLPNCELERRGIEYFRPDKNRYDGYPNHLSLSISSRNNFLIEKYKEEKRIIEPQTIQVDSSVLVLYKDNRLYCDRNASASSCRKGSTIDDLEACFANSLEYATTNNDFSYNRKELGLPENIPTDPQAEILFGGHIDKEFLWTSSIPDYTRKEAEKYKSEHGYYPWDKPECYDFWF